MPAAKPASFASLQRSHPLAVGLRHAWIPGGERDGKLFDLVGKIHLTNESGVTFGAASRPGYRLSLDGSGASVSDAAAMSAPIAPPFTMFVLAERPSISGKGTFFSHHTGGNDGVRMDSNASNLRFTLGGVANINTFVGVLTADRPFLYSVSVDVDNGNYTAHYEDFDGSGGIARATASIGSILNLSTLDEIDLGAFTTSERLTGHIYAALWWDRQLSDSEVTLLFSDPYAMFREQDSVFMFAGGAPPAGGFFARRYYDQFLSGGPR